MNKLLILLSVVLIGTACTSTPVETTPENTAAPSTETAAKAPTGPLSYSTGALSTTVSKLTGSFDYTSEQLASMAEECGNSQAPSYFEDLVSKFSDADKIRYKFKYSGESQESDTFIVTVLPNKAGYSSLDEFKKDFDQCVAGGDAYPTMLNSDWLLFVNSCGTGFDDGSGKPIGCQEIRDVVEPTLNLN